MPKDSPVIVKSPKMASHSGLLAVATSSSSSKHHAGGISVNKEVAIDPEDKCCYGVASSSSSSQVESLPQPSSSTAATSVQAPPPHSTQPAPMSICTEVGCSSCPLAAPPSTTENTESTLRSRPEYVDEPPPSLPPHCERLDREDVGLVFERRLRRERSCERGNVAACAAMRFGSFALAPLISGPAAHEYFPHEAPPPPQPPHSYAEHVVKSYEVPAVVVAPRLAATTPPHPHSFLTIKQEPTDWSSSSTGAASSMPNDNHHEHSQEAGLSPKQPLDFKINTVKLEANLTPHDDSEEQHTLRDYNNFKLLVCEICQKSFEDTKTLVRHLGTHAAEPTVVAGTGTGVGSSSSSSATANNNNSSSGSSNMALRALKTYVPKKRRRVSVSARATVGAALLLDKNLSHAPHSSYSSSHSQQQENNMDHVTLLCDLCST